jgi:hypothetical protein
MEAAPKRPGKVGRRSRRGTSRHRPSPRHEGFEAAVRRVEHALACAAREAYMEMFGHGGSQKRPFPMELKVVIEPGDPWRLATDPTVREQIRNAVLDMGTQVEAFRRGRVFCYRCESSECPHSYPPRPTTVFGGYSSTGTPRWPELPHVLLELKHPDVDLLYEPTEQRVIAAYMDGAALKDQQLNVFGRFSKAYDILGQAVFGFVNVSPPGSTSHEPERVAFTLQAVESRRTDGSPRLELNVIGRLWDGTPAMEALAGPFQLRIQNMIAEARLRIGHLVPRRRPGADLRPDTASRVEKILLDVVRRLGHLSRQKARRTTHAEQRGLDRRPTSKAWRDAETATDERILWDERQRTVVVLGPRNRVHIFTVGGRHVTSLLLNADAIQGRIRCGRWQRPSADCIGRFSEAVGRERGGLGHPPPHKGDPLTGANPPA